MNRVKRQESGNELQSSQRLGLQSASCKLLNTATVPVPAAEVQLKKSIGGILKKRNMTPHSFFHEPRHYYCPQGEGRMRPYLIRRGNAHTMVPSFGVTRRPLWEKVCRRTYEEPFTRLDHWRAAG